MIIIGAAGYDPDKKWSKWSTPVDTGTNGFWLQNGLIQYRTNLDTGLIERRTIQ